MDGEKAAWRSGQGDELVNWRSRITRLTQIQNSYVILCKRQLSRLLKKIKIIFFHFVVVLNDLVFILNNTNYHNHCSAVVDVVVVVLLKLSFSLSLSLQCHCQCPCSIDAESQRRHEGRSRVHDTEHNICSLGGRRSTVTIIRQVQIPTPTQANNSTSLRNFYAINSPLFNQLQHLILTKPTGR